MNSLFNPVIKGQGDTKDSTCDVSGVGNEGRGGRRVRREGQRHRRELSAAKKSGGGRAKMERKMREMAKCKMNGE